MSAQNNTTGSNPGSQMGYIPNTTQLTSLNAPMTNLPPTVMPIMGNPSPYSQMSTPSPYSQGPMPSSIPPVTQPPINTNALLAILSQMNSVSPKQPTDLPMDSNQLNGLFNTYRMPYNPPMGMYHPPPPQYMPPHTTTNDFRGGDNYRPPRRSDAIIVCNLPQDITVEVLAEEFEKYGELKYDRSKTPHKPLIIIYFDGNSPKGEAKVIFEDPEVAARAVSFYNGKNIFGNGPLKVHLANPPNRERDTRDRGRDKRGFDRGFDDKPKSFSGKGGAPREGDWICPSCDNNNFSWREFCHQCGKEKTDDVVKVSKTHLENRGNRLKVGNDRRQNRKDPY